MLCVCKQHGQARREPDGMVLWCEPGKAYDIKVGKDGKVPAHFEAVAQKVEKKPQTKAGKKVEDDL